MDNCGRDILQYILKYLDNISLWTFSQTCKKYTIYKPNFKTNPICEAAKYGYLNIVKNLYEQGYKLNSFTISDASYSGNLDLVKFLVSVKCNYNELGIFGAIAGKHTHILKYLISINCQLSNILGLAKIIGSQGTIDILNYMILHYPDLNNSYYKYVICSHAARNCNIEILNHAIINNYELKSCIFDAAKGGNLNVILLLKKYNPNIKITIGVFAYACSSGNLELVQYLYNNYYNIIKNKNTTSCFKYAIFYNRINIMNFLLQNNFAVNIEKLIKSSLYKKVKIETKNWVNTFLLNNNGRVNL